MSYLVTGGTGLWGTYVTRLLVQEGAKVVIFQRNPVENRISDLLEKHEGESIEIVRGDIQDLAHLIRTAKEHKVNRIIHLASLLTPACAANPLMATQVNCVGTINVFETARILGVEKVVWASSGKVFGPPEKYEQEYIPDDAPHHPVDVYAACKSFNEEIAKHYFTQYGVDIIGLRPGLVYSSAQTGGGGNATVIELIVKPALGQPGTITMRNGLINWQFAEDAARAAIMASKTAKTKTRVFNVNGDMRTMAEAVDCVRKLIPDAKFTVLPASPGTTRGSQKRDGMRAKEEIGYEPKWTMEQGIEQTIRDIRAGMV